MDQQDVAFVFEGNEVKGVKQCVDDPSGGPCTGEGRCDECDRSTQGG